MAVYDAGRRHRDVSWRWQQKKEIWSIVRIRVLPAGRKQWRTLKLPMPIPARFSNLRSQGSLVNK